MKNKFMMVGLLTLGLLYGCTEADSQYFNINDSVEDNTSQDTPASERYATEYVEPASTIEIDREGAPKGFQDGLVTPEYFIALNTNFDEWFKVRDAWDSADLNDQGNRLDLIDTHLAFAEFIEDNLYLSPTTEAEQRIQLYLSAYRESAENLISSRISYLESMSSVDLRESETYYKTAKAELVNLLNVMDEYELFYD